MNQTFLPYDFIELKKVDDSYSYKQKGDLSGVLHVTMTVKTPMFAVKEFGGINPNPRFIPGSSIKGMLRNAAEIVWNDHLTVLHDYHQKDDRIPDEWKKSEISIQRHGLGSHLFGFTSDNTSQEKEGEPLTNAYGSALTFTNAQAVGNRNRFIQQFKRNYFSLMKPEGLSCKYYVVDNKKRAAGRKIYLAGTTKDVQSQLSIPQVPNELKDFVGTRFIKKTVQDQEVLIYPNSVFTFKVYFNQLTRQHLADVIRLLELERGAFHALGKGKPLGFGRNSLKVDKIVTKNSEDIFDLGKPVYSGTLSKEELLQTEENSHEELLKEFIELSRPQTFNRKKAYATRTVKSLRYRLNKEKR